MLPKLSILHVNPERGWGGGEVQVLELTTHLHRSGHRSVVAAHPSGILYRRLASIGLPVAALPVRNHLDLLAGFRLRSLVRSGRYDIVHFHTARAHALSPWLKGLPAKRVVTRRMDYAIKKGMMSQLLYTRQVDTVVAISQGVRQALLAADVPATRIQIIPSGINTAHFISDPHVRAQVRQSYGFAEHERVVLSVGALVERKSHQTLLRAAQQVKEQGLQLRYVICGEGNLRTNLENQARALGLQAEVLFTGFCSDVSKILAAADFFVHVPVWEGLGVAVIEAMAAGVPVIASRVGGIPELIIDRQTGFLIPPQDPTALASVLSCLVRSPALAQAVGRAGQIRACSQFDTAITATSNEALYYRLLGLGE